MPFQEGDFSSPANTPVQYEPQSPDGFSGPSSSTAPVLSPTSHETFGRAIAYGLPVIGAGLVDTLGQSLGLLHNDTVPNFLKSISGDQAGSLGDFYANNQAGARTLGEVAGMFLPGMAAMKVLKTVRGLREAGAFGESLAGGAGWANKSIDVLLGNSADMAAKEAAIAEATKAGAAVQGVWAGKNVATPAVVAARNSYYASRAVDAVRTTIAFEVGTRAAFNSSSTFYPADYTLMDQVKWAGAGLGVGVGIEFVQARYAVRNMIQAALKLSTATAGETATALSPMQKNITDVIFRPNERGLGLTAYASLKADLKDIAKNSGNQVLQTNLKQDITNADAVIYKGIGDLGADGHAIFKRWNVPDDSKALGVHALDNNPTAFLFATRIAPIPEGGPGDFYVGVQKILDKAKTTYNSSMFAASSLADPIAKTAAEKAALDALLPVEQAANEIHYVIEPDGRYTVYKNRADNWLDFNNFSQIKRERYSTPATVNGMSTNIKNSKLIVNGDNSIILHDNFRAEIPPTPTPMDFSALYAAGSKLIKEWRPVEGQEFVLTPALNWRTSEMTVALAEAKPEAISQIKLGGGFSSLNDVKFKILNEKFKEFQKLMPDTGGLAIPAPGSLAARFKPQFTPAQVIQRLNLPEPIGAETQPVIEMFAHAKLQGMTDLNEMFPINSNSLQPAQYNQWDLVQTHLRNIVGMTDPKVEVPTAGVLLKQAVSDSALADAPKPILVAAKSLPYTTRPDAMVIGMVQAKRDVQLGRLAQISPANAPVVSSVMRKIISSGDGDLNSSANMARAVQTLQDGLASGTGQVVYADRINEQFPALKALQLIAQDGDKFVSNYVKEITNNSILPKAAQMLKTQNKADLFDFNRIEQAYRHGFDIKDLVPVNNGTGYMFKLDPESKINSQLQALHFGDEEHAIDMLPDMSVTAKKNGYTPLIVSKAAGDLAKAISDVSIQSGQENNALRFALGKSPIALRDFHLPTPELSREGTYFVKNSSGRVMASYAEPGNYANNKARAQSAAEVLTKQTGDMHIAVPLDTVKAEHQINDDNFFSLIDYSDQLAKTGAGIQGGLAHTTIDTGSNTMKAMLQSLEQQYLNIGIRARAAIFEPELNYARQAAQTAAAQGVNKNLGGINIFDRYISTMFSQSPNTQKGAIGKIYGAVQDTFDNSLSWMNAHFTELTGSAGNAAAAKTMRTVLRQQSSAEEFKQFEKYLSDWSPFKEASDWAESTFKQKNQWASKPIAAALSRLSSSMSLRIFDVGTAINNFAGLMTNAPSVITALRQLPGESRDVWLSRTAAWGTQLADGVVTFSPMKAMAQASKNLWSGKYSEPMMEAAKHGYFQPEYASLTQALTVPQKPSMAALHNWTQKASYLADKSEIISRQLAWGMGYSIGKDLHQFTDEKNAYIFANNFVNEMIGNYSPNNKPAMFQGVLGLPLGAFQTYMFNFYRRMYGMVERGDKAALLAQYAAQASIFGGQSVPGYAAWNSVFQQTGNGSDDFTSRANRNLEPGVGELLLHGSLSNIPKIFTGLNGDGLAFYTRGSVDFTQPPPTLLDMSKAPPLQFLNDVIKGTKATINNVFGTAGFSLQQQEEIMANFSTNRALKSIMEMAANAKTDQQGNVVVAGTRDAMHIAASLLGTQTSATRAAMDAANAQKVIQLQQEDLRSTLDAKTKSILRGGEITLPALQSIVNSYINASGNPQYLGQWFRNSFINATTPKIQTQLESLGRQGKMLEFQDMLARLQQNQNPNQSEKGN